MSQGEAFTRAEAALIEVGLGGAANGMVGEWTPEMRRRLAYARALLTEPDVLLMDAPARTDEPGTAAAIAIGCARRGAAVVWAVERLDELAGAARTVTLLAYGRVRYSGTVSALADRSTRGWAAARAA
jgi:ABC-type multidrug transport system ATPase subunit